MDIWALLDNPQGNLHISDIIFFEERAVDFAQQGKCFALTAIWKEILPAPVEYLYLIGNNASTMAK